jgi:hypothetical protein
MKIPGLFFEQFKIKLFEIYEADLSVFLDLFSEKSEIPGTIAGACIFRGMKKMPLFAGIFLTPF